MLLEEQLSHRLFQSRSCLRDAVSSWLDEELNILRLQQSTGGTGTGKSPGKERHPKTLKLGCSLSVFSSLIRLLVDHEVIQEMSSLFEKMKKVVCG